MRKLKRSVQAKSGKNKSETVSLSSAVAATFADHFPSMEIIIERVERGKQIIHRMLLGKFEMHKQRPVELSNVR